MTGGDAGARDGQPFRLVDHIGVICGVLLGLVVLAFLVVLALAGSPGALAIIVVALVGIAFIFLGGRMHGGGGARGGRGRGGSGRGDGRGRGGGGARGGGRMHGGRAGA